MFSFIQKLYLWLNSLEGLLFLGVTGFKVSKVLVLQEADKGEQQVFKVKNSCKFMQIIHALLSLSSCFLSFTEFVII